MMMMIEFRTCSSRRKVREGEGRGYANFWLDNGVERDPVGEDKY